MSVEKALGLKLQLIPDFSKAPGAADQLGIIADGIERLKKIGSFTLPGIDELAQSINTLTQRVDMSTKRVGAMGNAMTQTTTKARAKKQAVDQVTVSVDNLANAAGRGSSAILRLGTSMTQFGDSAVIVDRVGTAFVGVTAEAVRAKQAVDDLEASLLRLSGMRGVGYGATPLGTGVRDSQAFTQILPPGRTPIGGYSSRYGGALTGAGMLALPGGVDPRFNASDYWANQRAGGGGLPPIYVPPSHGFGGGNFWKNTGAVGKGLDRVGNQMQAVGYAGVINAALLGGLVIPGITSAANTQDLQYRNREAIVSAGGSHAQSNQFNEAAMQIARDTGSPFDQTVGGVYDFVSASPENLTKKYGKDPEVQKALIAAYERVAKMQVAGSASTHHLTMEESSLDVNNLITNLGFDTSTPKKYTQAVKDATNILINLKNRTATQVDLAASSFRAIGPIGTQSDLSADEIVGWVAAMASGKIRGAPAGQGLKRVLMRQAMPVAKVRKLQAMASAVTHGRDTLDLYDKDGKTKSLGRFGEEVVDFEDRNKLNASQRTAISGELAGLYALPQMGLFLKSLRSFKNAPGGATKGFEAYGASFRTGKVAGKDALEGSYEQRAAGNLQVQINKTKASGLTTLQHTFVTMAPEIDKVLKDLDKLFQWFDKLDPATKKNIVNFVVLSAGASALSGIFNIFFGNALRGLGTILKLGAGIATFGKVVAIGTKAIKIGEDGLAVPTALEKIALGFRNIITVVGGTALRAIPVLVEGITTATEGLGAAIFGVPIVGWILGIIAAIALLAVAWNKDWGGIREKTAAVLSWLKQEIPKIPEQLGYAFARGIALAADFYTRFAMWMVKLPGVMAEATVKLLEVLVAQGPSWYTQAAKWCQNLIDGIGNGWNALLQSVKGHFTQLLDLMDGKAFLDAGISFAKNFAGGFSKGLDDSHPQIKESLQRTRDLLPGSEPKDSSSPLTNLAQSGRALVDNFMGGVVEQTPNAVAMVSDTTQAVRDAVDAIVRPTTHKAVKGHKVRHKAIPTDSLISLHPTESIAQIERDAKIIEAALTAVGARLHKKWIDLMQGNTIERVYGDPGVYRKAIANDQKNATARYAAQTAKYMGGADGYGGLMGRINGELTGIGTKSQRFTDTKSAGDDKLKQAILDRKNQELPTLRELQREYGIEITQKRELLTIYNAESVVRDKLLDQVNQMLSRAAQLNGTDATSIALKKQLHKEADALWQQAMNVNGVLLQQNATISTLSTTIGTYSQAIDAAANKNLQWSKILSDSFAKAGQDAMTRLGTAISNGLDSLFQNIFGAKRGGIVGFLGQFFSDAFSTAFSTAIKGVTDTFSKTLSGTFAKLFSNMFHLGGSSSSSTSTNKPQKVQITDGSGSDLGQDIHDSTVSTSSNTASLPSGINAMDATIASFNAYQASKARTAASTSSDASSADSSDPLTAEIQKLLKSNVGKMVQGLAGAFTGYQTATQPGTGGAMQNIMGATEVYGSISSMPGGTTPPGQMVAIAAALFTLFSHHDNPAAMPDKYDTTRFTTDVGELQGHAATAYGPAFNPVTDPIMQQLGGKSMLQYIEDWLSQNQGSKDPQTQALVQSLLSQFGTSGGGQLAFDKNIGQETVIGGSLHGSYTDLHNAAEDAITSITKLSDAAAQAALVQQQNADRLAASFTSLIFGGPNGFFIPYGATGVGSGSILSPDPITKRGQPVISPIDSRPPTNKHQPPGGRDNPRVTQVHVDLSGMTIDAASISALEKALNDALPQIVSAVQENDYSESRRYGNYVSAVSS